MKPKVITGFIPYALILGLLSACQIPGSDPIPTPFPQDYLPTVVALTGRAAMATTLAGTPSPIPSHTASPTETSIPPTALPSETPTAIPSTGNAQIQIQSPGPMSKVTSPILLRVQAVSGASELVQIDLQGEDGRLLARKLERIKSWPGGFYFSLRIPFEIKTAAELGRITISTKDGEGRLQSLAATHVLMLSVGEEEITPVHDFSERVVFYTPGSKDIGLGGSLAVEGRFTPFNDQQAVLELLDPEGDTIGLRVLDFVGTDAQTFSTTIPYKVSEVTEARLVFRQEDDRLEGLMYLYSQLITLYP